MCMQPKHKQEGLTTGKLGLIFENKLLWCTILIKERHRQSSNIHRRSWKTKYSMPIDDPNSANERQMERDFLNQVRSIKQSTANLKRSGRDRKAESRHVPICSPNANDHRGDPMTPAPSTGAHKQEVGAQPDSNPSTSTRHRAPSSTPPAGEEPILVKA